MGRRRRYNESRISLIATRIFGFVEKSKRKQFKRNFQLTVRLISHFVLIVVQLNCLFSDFLVLHLVQFITRNIIEIFLVQLLLMCFLWFIFYIFLWFSWNIFVPIKNETFNFNPKGFYLKVFFVLNVTFLFRNRPLIKAKVYSTVQIFSNWKIVIILTEQLLLMKLTNDDEYEIDSKRFLNCKFERR